MGTGSGSFNLSKSSLTSGGGYIQGRVEYNYQTYIEGNYSTIGVTLYIKKDSDSIALTTPTEGDWVYSVTVDNTTYRGVAKASVLTDWVKIYTGSGWRATHDANGLRTFTISASVDAPSETAYAGKTTSGSLTATRGVGDVGATVMNSLTCSTKYFNGSMTYKYTPAGAEWYNKRWVYLDTADASYPIRITELGQKYPSQQTEAINFSTVELTKIYGYLTSATSGTIRVVIQTYTKSNYTGQIGSASSKSLKLSIPTSVKPTIDFLITPSYKNNWIKSLGQYVAGHTGLSVTATALPAYGAPIKSYNLAAQGPKTAYSSQTHQLNVNTLPAAGTVTITGTATDSRGRSASVSEKITVLPYSAPNITYINIQRGTYDAGWTANDEGTDIQIIFKTTLSLTAQGNTYDVALSLDGNTITPDYGTTAGLASGESQTVYLFDIDGDHSHALQLVATDAIGENADITVIVPTTVVTVEYNTSGKGIAFGKTSEKDAFECAMDAEFSGSLKRVKEDGSVIMVDDTGWIDLGLSDSVTTTSSASAGHYNGCAYRVVNGNHVYVAFNVRATYSGSAVTVSGTPIPSQYRPTLQPYAIVTLNGLRVARILVSRSNGHAMIDWIRNVSDEAEPAEHIATWIDGYIDYWI